MSKKFVKAVGLHNVFNEISDTSLDIASIKSNISEIVNSDSVIFITANEDDIYGYPSGSKYIWAQNELYPTNYPNIYTATLEDASNGEDGLATAVDIYNTIESLERVIATHISALGDVVGLERNYSIVWNTRNIGLDNQSTIKEGIEYIANNYANINDERIALNSVWSSSKVSDVLYGKQNANYLKFTANTGNSTITFYNYESNSPDIQYSFDGVSWQQWYENSVITLYNAGSYIYVKGSNQAGFSSGTSYSKFTMSGSIAASGNIMSLIDDGTCNGIAIPCDYCFHYLFQGCTCLTSAPELPAIILSTGCYDFMFDGCTSLTTAPELPATTLVNYCYQYMFFGCTNLTTAPELPATTLARGCYGFMFKDCTSLTSAPELPATTLANYCYSNMFQNCTSLTSAPELPATTLVDYCYQYMFQNCASLNYIKCLATSGISTNYSTTSWVDSVASSGTFIKMPDVIWPIGNNGIPINWASISLSPNQIYDNGHVYDSVKYSLAEGLSDASGYCSHAEGYDTIASGRFSHAEGFATSALNIAEHASGQYNVSHSSIDDAYSTQMSVGVGNQYISKNALEVYRNGNIYINGIGNYDGTDINKNVPRPIQETLVQSAIGGAKHIWCGTQLEYDSLPIKYINTLYFIKEDTEIEYVDLGLTSGNLWATANIGATNSDTSISWYGQYFAWGDIYPSMFYNWESYKFCTDSSDNLIKYCDNTNYGYNGFTDVLNILEPSDDVANAVYGGDWRIPSTEDFEELLNETAIEWITDYQGIAGLNGYTFSKNEETLFLPMAGYSYYDSNSQTSEINEDSGNYWTSEITLNGNGTDARSAIILYFNTNNMPTISDNIRCQGLSVRPILKLRENLSSAESEIR